MAILSIDANGLGKPLFEGSVSYRQKDDAADNKVSGSYSHQPIEFSATEANEWQSVLSYIATVMKSGALALSVRNVSGSTLIAGPIRISGFDVANSAFTIVAADADGAAPAQMLLLNSLANNTNGTAYAGGTWTSNIDTTASSIGAIVYLRTGGGATLTAPTSINTIQQEIGRVQTLANPGVIAGEVQAPTKFGSAWLQAGVVTLGSDANLNTRGGTGSLNLLSTGQRNTAIGYNTLSTLTSGSENTAHGNSAMSSCGPAVTGNTGVGENALANTGGNLVAGNNNTALGFNAGQSITDGTDNVCLGKSADVSAGAYKKSIALGSGAQITADNQVVIGSSTAPAQEIIVGNGVTHATPVTANINATSGTAGNQGGTLCLCGGKGNANHGGNIIFKTDPDGSGLAVRAIIGFDGGLIFSGLSTATRPSLSSGNQASLFYDLTLQQYRLSENGGGYRSVQCFASKTVTTTYQILAEDDVLRADATGAAFSLTLPNAAANSGRKYTIKKVDATANVVTVLGTIDGAGSITMNTQYAAYTVQSNGTAWDVISKL